MATNGEHMDICDCPPSIQASFQEPLLKAIADPPVPEGWKRRIQPLQRYMKENADSPVTWLGLAVFFGILCGLVSFIYAHYFRALLWLVWAVGSAVISSACGP